MGPNQSRLAAGSAEGSYDNVDPAQVLGALKRFSGVLSRLACALVSAGDIFGTDGSSRPGAPCNPEELGEISFGESAGLGLVCHVLHSRGRLLIRVGDGRPVRGFPNLKKLDLHLFDTQRNNIDDMLSCCPNLEWLSLMRCRMKDELKVKQQLAHLVYLHIAYCSITKADLHAKYLRTFVFRGIQLPIDLGQVKQLETADLHLYNATLEYILTVLPKSVCCVQNLSLNTYLPLEMPSFLKNICSLSQLKILQLFLFIDPDGTDNILSLGSFLRAAPLIEKLEMHFDIPCMIYVKSGSLRSLSRCSYDCMRSVHITGFTATTVLRNCKNQVGMLVFYPSDLQINCGG
ncbi:hypothetical protein PR202_ga17871 [Eleusine coracana subsp. coracana]|uniref:At1g61320/AtMIF1 LRR domain-containing protein n=1 Tax=Eleusine coracana subsp. coracana TaxID=191504 RepID=A0AAV5CRP6_ELECO|nr:hypothetical protein PR202_ga17871 [Eleusine coracana subsp. coracana]